MISRSVDRRPRPAASTDPTESAGAAPDGTTGQSDAGVTGHADDSSGRPATTGQPDAAGPAPEPRTEPPPSALAAIRIRGFGGALPARRLTNDDLVGTLDTSDEWITTRTGIRARHRAENETTASLAADAARRALDRAELAGSDLDLIVLATSTPDSACPSTAARVAADLESPAGAFDLNGACTGFIHALLTAASHLRVTGTRRALVIGADRFLSLIDPDDRTTAVLFGDGAGAIVIENAARHDRPDTVEPHEHGSSPGTAPIGILAADLGGDPTGIDILEVPPGRPHLRMDGPELFRRAVRALTASGRRVLDDAGLTPDDVDLYLPHQANRRIVDAAASRLGIPDGRVVHDMTERANTSAASIPLALDAVVDRGELQPGQTLLLSGIGAGLGWGSLLIRWSR